MWLPPGPYRQARPAHSAANVGVKCGGTGHRLRCASGQQRPDRWQLLLALLVLMNYRTAPRGKSAKQVAEDDMRPGSRRATLACGSATREA